MVDTNALAVFTAKSTARILREGGSSAWVLNPVRAKECSWLVCAQNRHNPDHELDGNEPHGSGFLVGRISGLAPATGEPDRWLVEIDRFARVELPSLWAGWRNPVRYTTLEDLGIDLDTLTFEDMPHQEKPAPTSQAPALVDSPAGLTIAQAKAGLATMYGVDPESIEITIRG